MFFREIALADLLRINVQPAYIDRHYVEDDIYYCVRFDRTARGVKETNAQIRLNASALKAPNGLRWALSIPEDDHRMLLIKYPDLGAVDGQTKHKAYQQFMKSAESEPYRVYEPSRRGMTA